MAEKLGNYILVAPIARGGMAMVYRAVHEPSGREVALKVLTPALAADGEYISRFLREARTLMDLKHPNIVQVFEANTALGQYFISMELLGETLSDSLVRQRAAKTLVPQAKALVIARQIASALQFAHDKGLVHRDVKPSNVLIAHDAGGRTRYVLSDFGVVKQSDATRLTHTEMTIGTPAYMSPEQLLTPGKIDQRSDLYSLGMLLFEMLSGAPVYEGMTPVALMYNIAHEPLPPISKYRADLTKATRDILEKLLAKKPELRFQTGNEVIAAIDRALDQKVERSKVLPLLLVAGATLVCLSGLVAAVMSAQGGVDGSAANGAITTATPTPTATPTRQGGSAATATARPGNAPAGTASATPELVATSTLAPALATPTFAPIRVTPLDSQATPTPGSLANTPTPASTAAGPGPTAAAPPTSPPGPTAPAATFAAPTAIAVTLPPPPPPATSTPSIIFSSTPILASTRIIAPAPTSPPVIATSIFPTK